MRRRQAWVDDQFGLDPERLVFGVTWPSTNMARRYGRSLRGRRLRVGIPHGHRKTAIAGLRIAAPFVRDDPINRVASETYVDKVLAPKLRPGDIVIMDMCGRPPSVQEESLEELKAWSGHVSGL